ADEQEQVQRSALTGAAFEKIRSWHLIPGPQNVARAIESAVVYNRKTVLVRPEAYLVYLLRRLSPTLLYAFSNLIFGSRTITFAYPLGKNPTGARLLGR
ncbi:oxidoreductase, partial [Mycobacteroides abscessus subsp. massiliense]